MGNGEHPFAVDTTQMPDLGRLMSRKSTRDVVDYSSALPGWRMEVMQVSPGRFTGEISHFRLENIEVIRETSDQALMKRGMSWPGAMVFSLPITAQGNGWLGGSALQHRFSLLADGRDLPEIITPKTLELVVLAFKRDWFALRAHTAGYGQLVDHAFMHNTLVVLPEGIETLTALFQSIFRELAVRPILLEKPSSRVEIESIIIETLLEVLATAQERKPRLETSSKKIADKARALVIERSSDPPEIGEIASILGVSRRHLQNCFQESFGINAKHILRVVRLNRVRKDFIRAQQKNKTVSIGDIAAEWGFWHWSRFSASYRELFGELPSETKRNLLVSGR